MHIAAGCLVSYTEDFCRRLTLAFADMVGIVNPIIDAVVLAGAGCVLAEGSSWLWTAVCIAISIL